MAEIEPIEIINNNPEIIEIIDRRKIKKIKKQKKNQLKKLINEKF